MSEPRPKSDNSLFSKFGVELEYMIVHRETLEILPIADKLLTDDDGVVEQERERGPISWSNELALHVVELKTTDPVPRLDGLAETFQGEVREIQRRLAPWDAMLMPTAMHPWMLPSDQTQLWPHGDREIYNQFDRIFGCQGHGWSNLQSVHLNLPFQTETEFVRLHAAIRLILPLLPALAASSPFVEGRRSGWTDYRLEVYRQNCRRIPSVTDGVIPEPIQSIQDYHERILRRIYRDLEPHDPEGILKHEWANARGAIARFERNTIEIRVIDIQECPAADLQILNLVAEVLRALTTDPETQLAAQHSVATDELRALFLDVARTGSRTPISSKALLDALNIPSKNHPLTAREVWNELAHRFLPSMPASDSPLGYRLAHGPLAEWLLEAAGERPDAEALKSCYRQLSTALTEGAGITYPLPQIRT